MNKKYKIVFLILLVNVLIVLGIVLINTHKDQGYVTVILDNFGRWIYSDKKWSKIPSSDIPKYSWKKYDLYADNEFFGNYYLMYNKKWYIFDNDKKAIKWRFDTVGLGGNIDSSLDKILVYDMKSSEYSYAKNALESINIKNQDISKIGFKKKYTLDLDKDNKKETIYAISNAQMQGEYSQKLNYTVLFLRSGNKNIILYQHVENKYNSYGGCIPSITSISVGKDKISKLIVNCSFYSDSSILSSIYDYDVKNKRFNRLAVANFQY